jgi:hypothetical protein
MSREPRPTTVKIAISLHEIRILVEDHIRHADEMVEVADWLELEQDNEGAFEFRALADRRYRRAEWLRTVMKGIGEAWNVVEVEE